MLFVTVVLSLSCHVREACLFYTEPSIFDLNIITLPLLSYCSQPRGGLTYRVSSSAKALDTSKRSSLSFVPAATMASSSNQNEVDGWHCSKTYFGMVYIMDSAVSTDYKSSFESFYGSIFNQSNLKPI